MCVFLSISECLSPSLHVSVSPVRLSFSASLYLTLSLFNHRVILGVRWCVATVSEALCHGVTSPADPRRSQASTPTSADMATGSEKPFRPTDPER